jgi:NHLM bacteriocin system ABC transporter peptidase/ATP-binding protein
VLGLTQRAPLVRIEQECHKLARRRGAVRGSPTVIQMEAVECGAAALGILLGYFGKHVPLEDLRVACGISRDGSTAKNLVLAAATYGLTGAGRRMEIAPLMQLGRPVIVFWAFQHFLVVDGFERRGRRTVVRLNDPANGPRRMSLAEFDEGFTGIVLDLVPDDSFTRGGRQERTLPLLLGRMSRTGRGLPLVLLASVVLVVPGVVAPVLAQYFIDSVYGGGGSVLPVVLGVAVCALATLILACVQTHYLRLTEARIALSSSTRFVHRLLRLPIGFFLQRRAAELARRITSNDDVAQVLTRDLVITVVNLLLIAVYGTVLLAQDVPLALLAMSVALVNLVVLRAVMRSRVDASTALNAEEGRLAVATLSVLSSIETVKASGTEPGSFVRWAGFMAKVTTESQRLGVPTAMLTVLPPLLATVNSGLVLLFGGLRAADGAITVGLLFAFQTLLAAFSRPLTQLTNQVGRLQSMTSQLHRLRDVEAYDVDPAFRTSAGTHGRLSGALRFEGAAYAFGPLAPPLIQDLSFALEPGLRMALVGESGSGKSTVGRLAAGLVEPTEGRILFDGRSRHDWSRQSVAASVSYVDQRITLFEGSVRDNVCFWDPDMPDEQIVAALRDAEILNEVSRRAGGMNTSVAEGGANFSGGQRQRLDLARALVTNPTLMILDEATSAMDPVTERAVMDNLRRRGCALLVIAHRLSTVRDADLILVMHEGRVVEQGRHDELMAAQSHYHRLVEAEAADEEGGLT